MATVFRPIVAFLVAAAVSSCAPSKVVQPPPMETDRPTSPPVVNESNLGVSPKPVEPRRLKTVAEIEKELALPQGALLRQKAEFTLGIGDAVTLTFRPHERFNQTTTIMPDGNMNVAGLGSVRAGGKTIAELRAEIVRKATAAGFRGPSVDVDIKSIAEKFVTLVGFSTKSGRIKISGNGTILETLFAGGYNPALHKTHRIALIRTGRCSIIDIHEIIAMNNIDINIKLEAEDILMFLERGVFVVKGEVETPGMLPVPERGYVTLDEAIILAGGVKKTANVGAVQVLREGGNIESVDLNRYLYRRAPGVDVFIRPGDEIFFRPTRDVGVYVLGMVSRPGLHHRAGSMTVSQALALADHATFGAKIDEARLIRGYPDNPHVMAVNFSGLFNGDMAQDIAMQDGDVLVIPETALSDVFDFTTRLLAPLTGVTRTAVDVLTAKELSDK